MKNKAILEKDQTTHEGFLAWLAETLVASGQISGDSLVYTNLLSCAEEIVDQRERIKMLCGGEVQHKVVKSPAAKMWEGKMFVPSGFTEKQVIDMGPTESTYSPNRGIQPPTKDIK